LYKTILRKNFKFFLLFLFSINELKKDLENSFSSNITKNLLHKIYSVPIDNVGFINSIAEGQLKVSKLDGPKGHSQQGLGQAPRGSQLLRGPELVG